MHSPRHNQPNAHYVCNTFRQIVFGVRARDESRPGGDDIPPQNKEDRGPIKVKGESARTGSDNINHKLSINLQCK